MNNNIELASCDKSKCGRCDVVYIIMNYLVPLMQCLTNDIREYNMQLLTTKCLNTAVMLMFFLLGKRGLEHASYCDSRKMVERHKAGEDNNAYVLQRMRKVVLRTNIKYRYLYYILINDAYFEPETDKKFFFPGHVFIIEKVPYEPLPYFNVYHSYINQYDLKEYYETKNTLRYTYAGIEELMDKLKYILQSDVWDSACVQYWKDFTNVDTSSLKGGVKKDKLYICCSYEKVSTCVENIKKYVQVKLDEVKEKNPDEIYGDASYFKSAKVPPLTYGGIRRNLENILDDMQANLEKPK